MSNYRCRELVHSFSAPELCWAKKYWLSDLSQDPTEQINLADSNPQMLEKLLTLLNEHQKDAMPPRYPSVIQSAVLVDKTLLDEYVDGDEYVYSPN